MINASIQRLTARELEVAHLVALGHDDYAIAQRLVIQPSTVLRQHDDASFRRRGVPTASHGR